VVKAISIAGSPIVCPNLVKIYPRVLPTTTSPWFETISPLSKG
jgi:hypothetical protein